MIKRATAEPQGLFDYAIAYTIAKDAILKKLAKQLQDKQSPFHPFFYFLRTNYIAFLEKAERALPTSTVYLKKRQYR
jgi:hypothetical protein